MGTEILTASRQQYETLYPLPQKVRPNNRKASWPASSITLISLRMVRLVLGEHHDWSLLLVSVISQTYCYEKKAETQIMWASLLISKMQCISRKCIKWPIQMGTRSFLFTTPSVLAWTQNRCVTPTASTGARYFVIWAISCSNRR